MKILDKKSGYLNRHLDGLPVGYCYIEILPNAFVGTFSVICEGFPAIEDSERQGYLGAARTPSGIYHSVWEEDNSGFIYYKLY